MDTLEMSRDEIVALLEEQAHRRLGISAEEMLRRYRRGLLRDDCGKIADLVILASLLKKDDPLLAA